MKKSKKNRIVDQKRLQKNTDIDNHIVKDFFSDIKIIQEKRHIPKKYSEIFYEFIKPAIENFINEEMPLKRMLDWGQTIWNKGVAEDFPNHPHCKRIELFFPFFVITSLNQPLVSLLLARKREVFSGEKFFIAENSALLSQDGKMVITVSVEPIEDTNLN